MPSPINRYPRGILSLLDIKNFGRAPSIFPDELVPIVDMTQLYVTDQLRYTGAGYTGLAAPGDVSFGGPADGKLWIVEFAGVQVTTNATGSVSMNLYLATPQFGGIQVPLTNSVFANPAAVSSVVLHGPLIVQPGENLGVVFGTVTATVSYRYGIRLRELDV